MLIRNSTFNPHEHREELRVSRSRAIFHNDHGFLCSTHRELSDHEHAIYCSVPIHFKSLSHAYEWIEKGTIAELQECLGILNIGFTSTCFKLVKHYE